MRVFSVNLSAPGSVSRVAADLHPALVSAGVERFRDRHSLVVKRFEGEQSRARLRERLRPALRGTPAFEVRLTGVDWFENPPRGPGPVVYLAVESPGLLDVHRRLVDAFGAVDGLEGPDYTPHVTLGRGGEPAALASLSDQFEPVTWTASELGLYDAKHRETVARISLPA